MNATRILVLPILIFFTGCQTSQLKFTTDPSQGAKGVFLYLHYYQGMFGGDERAWDGLWYSRENLSIVAHLPTKSEFFILVRHSPDQSLNVTNSIRAIVNLIKEQSGVTNANDQWEKITQTVSIQKQSSRLD